MITSIIQSLFGVGVLLFGTPILLLLDYSFIESLLILLPISAAINTMQVYKDYKYIEFKIYKKIFFITLPFIVVSLYFMFHYSVNIFLVLGLFLMFIALKEYVSFIKNAILVIFKYDKIFYMIMGIVHGVTNLGGSLLTAKIFSTTLTKVEKRATIAISYLTFATFQMVTILSMGVSFDNTNYLYITVGVSTYLLINKFYFININELQYEKLFSIFLVVSGIALILKGYQW